MHLKHKWITFFAVIMIVSAEIWWHGETVDTSLGPHAHLHNQDALREICVNTYTDHLMAVSVKWFLTGSCRLDILKLFPCYVKEGLVMKCQESFCEVPTYFLSTSIYSLYFSVKSVNSELLLPCSGMLFPHFETRWYGINPFLPPQLTPVSC